MSITRPLEQGNETSELEWREAVLDLARAQRAYAEILAEPDVPDTRINRVWLWLWKPSAAATSCSSSPGAAWPQSAHQLQRLRQLLEQFLAEFSTHVKERHTRDLVGPIFPGMVRTALNDHIALLQGDLAIVQ
jgi:hypothetical protein